MAAPAPRPHRRVLAVVAPPAAHLAATGLLAWGGAGPLHAARGPGRLGFEEALALTAAAAAWCVLTWLTLGTLVAVAARLRDRPGLAGAAAARVPRLSRRLAGLLLGLGLAGAPTAFALPAHAGQVVVATRSAERVVPRLGTGLVVPVLDRPQADGGSLPGPLSTWTPDRPALPPRATPTRRALALVTSTPRRHPDVVDEVVVRRGDTLWDIAARHLGPRASAAEVAAAWPRWYAANRALVGPDPALIRPGQRLRPPDDLRTP
ncbi:MAG TPA: LysM domain-containing protein [Candidatus Eisenbacteria bacterium]|nr:LysM domain-containing protein [Candidatus Eisenbacteria bacterium]